MKYTLSDIRSGLQDPYLVAKELNELYNRYRGPGRFNHRGTGIFELDWDNLILLDACRFDVYSEVSSFSGNLSWRYTLGSRTPEFIRANFTGEQHYELIYVSENGWYRKLQNKIGADVFKSTLQDDEHFPTRHKKTTKVALEKAEKFPHKRILVHYLPPHHPYYGPLADEYLSEPNEQFGDLFRRIRKGELDVPDDVLREIYTQNLERIFPHVSRLLDSFSGKTVISADHGEYLGERSSPIPVKTYGHPTIYTEYLTKVPWQVQEEGPRKTIREDKPNGEKADPNEEHLNKHLRDLGYKV